nr:brain-specific angiogenesis inhibitor 1-associated protein 2-like protein 1 [Anolis sagrei ordinatus]
MSRDAEEVNKLTENTYKNVMEQFNPGLRNLINLGKNYEKAVSAMILAGRSYYDGVAKIGDIAVASPVSKELGHILIEISIAQKKLNDRLDESFKKFHKEIISELEKKTELDVKYMNYVETVTCRQSDIQRFIAEGCREALLEEKKRFCFLVDKHCSFAQHMHYYHVECSELLSAKLPGWQETCGDATKVPEKVMTMIEEIRTPGSTPVSGTPVPSPMIERNSLMLIGNHYDSVQRTSPKVPPAPAGRAFTSPLVDMFNHPPTATKAGPDRMDQATDRGEDSSLSRSASVATGLNMMRRPRVRTIFPHTAGSNKTLLSFAQGDTITLLVAEERDGWLYGEHDGTKVKGWFPSSYTKPLEDPVEAVPVPAPSASVPVRSVSSVNLAERSAVVLPPADYLSAGGHAKAASEGRVDATAAKNKALMKSPLAKAEDAAAIHKPDMNGIGKPPFLSGENPFATVKLRPTVTNDRSAPILR